MSVPLSGMVVLQPATDEVQQRAAAAKGCHLALQAETTPRVDVGDTPSVRLGICDMPAGELGQAHHTVRERAMKRGSHVTPVATEGAHLRLVRWWLDAMRANVAGTATSEHGTVTSV